MAHTERYVKIITTHYTSGAGVAQGREWDVFCRLAVPNSGGVAGIGARVGLSAQGSPSSRHRRVMLTLGGPASGMLLVAQTAGWTLSREVAESRGERLY